MAIILTSNHASSSTECSTTSKEKPTPVKDLWFEDGNLILQADNCLFRIYSGLLAARSSVFNDMLAFPPPEDGNPMMEGCHIVTLYDSASDMAYFLRAVFDSSYFEPPPSPTELPIVEAVLRLSLKYDVQYLRRRAVAHLSSTFPTTLAAWKARDAHRTIPPVDNTPFAAFRIARQFDLPWLVPAIMYCISSHPFDKTLDSAPWGTEMISMAWVDKRCAIVGRQKILALQARCALTLTKLAGTTVEGCTGDTCASTRLRCAETLSHWDMAGFLDYWVDNADMYASEFCDTCSAAFEQRCAAESESMWNALPAMFGLPDWDTLDEQRVQALE